MTTFDLDWVAGLASIMLAFEPRGWDVESDGNCLALNTLNRIGFRVCAYHLPVPIPRMVAPIDDRWRAERIDDAHAWARQHLGVNVVPKVQGQSGARHGNSYEWSFAWVAWVLTHREPWTFAHRPHRVAAELPMLRRAIEAAARLGGPTAVNELLINEADCNCTHRPVERWVDAQ